MTLGITGIIAAYILLAVLLLSINLYSKWPWQLKAGAIVITSAFYVITYFSFPALLGWPTTQDPPAQFRLLAAHVEQPDKEPDDAFAEVTEQKRGVKSIKIEFYDLPDPLFPDK